MGFAGRPLSGPGEPWGEISAVERRLGSGAAGEAGEAGAGPGRPAGRRAMRRTSSPKRAHAVTSTVKTFTQVDSRMSCIRCGIDQGGPQVSLQEESLHMPGTAQGSGNSWRRVSVGCARLRSRPHPLPGVGVLVGLVGMPSVGPERLLSHRLQLPLCSCGRRNGCDPCHLSGKPLARPARGTNEMSSHETALHEPRPRSDPEL